MLGTYDLSDLYLIRLSDSNIWHHFFFVLNLLAAALLNSMNVLIVLIPGVRS